MASLAAPVAFACTAMRQELLHTELWVTNGNVRAIARSGETLYLGGDFSYVGPPTGACVMVSATDGEIVGAFPEIVGAVRSVVSDGVGGWYVGGLFHSAGGEAHTNLVHVLRDGSIDPLAFPVPNDVHWHFNGYGRALRYLEQSPCDARRSQDGAVPIADYNNVPVMPHGRCDLECVSNRSSQDIRLTVGVCN